MLVNIIDKLGDWNPQFWREVKGSLKSRNIAIAAGAALILQFLVGQTFLSYLPVVKIFNGAVTPTSNFYCTGSGKMCLLENSSFVINWPWWWYHIFICLTILVTVVLLIGGSYAIAKNLAKEERRGTLNFIRYSPQSTTTILVGKVLGVPILVYIFALLTAPLQLWAGFAAQISPIVIGGFWVVLAASCAFFYSIALSFGLSLSTQKANINSDWQAGYASVLVLLFLGLSAIKPIHNNIADWLNLFSPLILLFHTSNPVYGADSGIFSYWNLQNLRWFYIPVGASIWGTITLVLLNYFVWTFWIWQVLSRRFANPQGLIISKQQSYKFMAGFTGISLGFILQLSNNGSDLKLLDSGGYLGAENAILNYGIMPALLNFVVLLILTICLSPPRQVLRDWARYRVSMRKNFPVRKQSPIKQIAQDLVLVDKSPAPLAIAINTAIATIPVTAVLLFYNFQYFDRIKVIFSALFFMSIVAIYASLYQFLTSMKLPQNSNFAAMAMISAIFLPPFSLLLLGLNMIKSPGIWLMSTWPWGGINTGKVSMMVMGLLTEWLVLILINWQLRNRLQKAGESDSKHLLATNSDH